MSDVRLAGDARPGAESDVERAPNVYALFAARARREPDARLKIDAAFGGIALVTAPFLPTLWWLLACPIVVVGCYGIWGLADRHLLDEDPPGELSARRDVLGGVKWAALMIGTLAAVGAVLGFMAAALGEWHH